MITADDYQWKALRTERTPSFVSRDFTKSRVEQARLERTIHALLGICTEAGEAQDMIKKHLIYERPYDATNVLEEAGDILWYVALLLDANGFTMTQAMERNLAKLASRYPQGFTPEAANNRDVKTERKVLEQKEWHDVCKSFCGSRIIRGGPNGGQRVWGCGHSDLTTT